MPESNSTIKMLGIAMNAFAMSDVVQTISATPTAPKNAASTYTI